MFGMGWAGRGGRGFPFFGDCLYCATGVGNYVQEIGDVLEWDFWPAIGPPGGLLDELRYADCRCLILKTPLEVEPTGGIFPVLGECLGMLVPLE